MTTIKLRRGTAAQWAAAATVLAAGEPGIETDTGICKVGDGSTAWASLNPILNATYAPIGKIPAGNRAVFWGDSLTLGSDVSYAHGQCYPIYLSLVSRGQIQYVYNAGIGGQGSTAILARFATDVAAYTPHIVFILDGTNDMSGGVNANGAFTTWKANKAAEVAAVRAIGAVPVLLTIPPNSTGTAVLYKTEVNRWNAWLRRYARANNITLVDTYATVVDPTTGVWNSSYLGDGTHWNEAGMLAVANAIYAKLSSVLQPNPLGPICLDTLDENNIIPDGVFNTPSGTSFPAGWFDNAGTPTGSAISYVTDAAVPGKLLTITSSSASGTRQFVIQLSTGTTTMPAVSANATSFALPAGINPARATLFIGSGATFETVKVTASSGAGPYTVTVRALQYAHSAGEQVVINAAPGDTLTHSGTVTYTGGSAGVTARLDYAGGSAGNYKPFDTLKQALTRAQFYQESVVPTGTTNFLCGFDVRADTSSTFSVGQVSLYNVTRSGL